MDDTLTALFKGFFVMVFIGIAFIPSVLGVELHQIQYEVEDGAVSAKHVLVAQEDVELIVPGDAFNFDVVVDGSPALFTLNKVAQQKEVVVGLTPGEHRVEIKYRTAAFLDSGRHDYVVGQVISRQSTDKLIVELFLPEGALLARPISSLNPPVSPRPQAVESTGRQIVIRWEKEAVAAGDVMSIFVVYEAKRPVTLYFLVSIVLLLVLFGGWLVWKRFGKKKHHVISTGVKKRFPHLLESEQKIMDALLKSDDHIMWQKELEIATGFTKSKLSRTVRHLEERGLVKKIPYGTSNKIQIIENSEEENSTMDESS